MRGPTPRSTNCSRLTARQVKASTASTDSTPQETQREIPRPRRWMKVGKYILSGRLLGEGATGCVHYGTCTATGREVALKCLSASAKNLNNEVSACRRVAVHGHSNICAFLGFLVVRDKAWIVMELCSRGEVFNQIESDGPIPEEIARSYARGMVAGVTFMHEEHGVAHRDIKLENMLLTKEGTVRICDFGLAHCYDQLDESRAYARPPLRSSCGTRSYTAVH